MDYGVTTETSLTMAQWSANDSQAVHSAIDQSLEQLAQMMLKGLLREPVAPPPKRTTVSSADAV